MTLVAATWLVVGLGVSPAAAHDTGASGEASSSASGASSAAGSGSTGEGETPLPWRGTILLFDQSVTTQTVHIGADYQSSDPTYELWWAFKPRYFVYDGPADKISLNLWANLYLELTNSDSTKYEHEPLIGPTYLWGSWAHTLSDIKGYKTSLSLGPRLGVPTDKAARGSGQLFSLGAMSGLSQAFPLAGKAAPSLNGAGLRLSVIYMHPFNRATVPTNEDIQQLRQDYAGRPIVDDVLRAGENVRNSLSVALGGDLQLLPKLGFSLGYVMQHSWAYSPSQDATVQTATGPASVRGVDSPTTHRVSPWFTASLDYDAIDGMSIGIGYYNLTRQIGPDGTYRSPFWSPEARFFLTLTGKLDEIYERIVAKPRHSEVASVGR